MQSSVLLAALVSAAATSDVVCWAADDGSCRTSHCPSRAEMSSAPLRSADRAWPCTRRRGEPRLLLCGRHRQQPRRHGSWC